jgi:hypothetical protein
MENMDPRRQLWLELKTPIPRTDSFVFLHNKPRLSLWDLLFSGIFIVLMG